MPELPEVEIHARRLQATALGKRITGFRMLDPRLTQSAWPDATGVDWDAAVLGRRVVSIHRRAKFLWLALEGDHSLLIHLRMTGRLRVTSAGDPAGAHTRLILTLDDSAALHFDDPRRFGCVQAVRTADLPTLAALAGLGPDALTEPLYASRLEEVCRGVRQPVKVLLMDQSRIGGLGNICACEVLFRVGIDPAVPAGRLNADACRLLAATIPRYLTWAIRAQEGRELIYLGERGAVNVFSVYRRTGEPCPRCDEPIAYRRLAGRGTWYCPPCQPVGITGGGTTPPSEVRAVTASTRPR